MIEGGKLFFMFCLVLSCHGTQDKTPPFPITSLLTCHVPDPTGGYLASMPEPRFRVPIQPEQPGSVWRPVASQFAMPIGTFSTVLLDAFLGSDFNLFFSSKNQPTDEPPLAVERLPVEGSGGSDMLFVEDPTQPPPGLAELDTDAERNSILRWIRDQNLGSCPLTAEWVRLHESYYPPFFAGSKCGEAGSSCSFPAGQTCQPDVGPGRLAYITVLRWDCCWSYLDGQWKWECGWRKVEAPIIVDCYCGCQPRQRTDFK